MGCSEPFGNAGSCCPLIHLAQGIVEGTRPKSPGMQIWVFQWNPGFQTAAGIPGQAALAIIRSRICSTIHIHDFPMARGHPDSLPRVFWERENWESSGQQRVPSSCWKPVAAQFGTGFAGGCPVWAGFGGTGPPAVGHSQKPGQAGPWKMPQGKVPCWWLTGSWLRPLTLSICNTSINI